MTFQPEVDVAEILHDWKGLTRGEKSKRINEAVRRNHKQAAVKIAVREVMLAEARLKSLMDSRGD